jgi:hypothetical protein
MLRAKRRRTRMHDNKGNPIFNTNNATSKQNNYVMKNNYLISKCCDKQTNKKVNCKINNEVILIVNGFEGDFSFVNGHYYISGYQNIKLDLQGIQIQSPIYTNINNKNIEFKVEPVSTGFGDIQMWSSTQVNNKSIKISYCSTQKLPPCTDFGPPEFYKSINPSINYIQNWEYTITQRYPTINVISSEVKYTFTDINKLECIKKTVERNPILGYRKQLLVCENSFEDIIITYNKLVKDGKIDISFDNIPFTFEYPLGGTFSSNMNLFNGVYKHDGNAYINENNSSFGFAYITGDKIWKFINQYTENNQAIQIIITSNKTDIFDIIKLEGINLNWIITIKIDGIAIPSDKINPSTFTSDLSVKYDEIHVKVSKIIKKFLQGAAIKNPTNTIYKDNYAKTCGKFRKEDSSLGKFCAYNNVILTKQNNNGIVDASYNYSTSQYLSRPNFMKCNNVYKKSNPRFSTQGAVSGGSRLNRLKYQTILKSQQKYNTLGNALFQFKLKVGYWEQTIDLKLYGYGDGNGITTIPGSLEPDNFKGNEIPTLNITENSFEKTYGLQIYFNKKIEEQISENMLNNFKIILNYNDVNIEFKYSDLTQFYNYGVQFEYDFDDDNTHPNYNLIKNIIGNGEIIGKTVNIIFIFNKLTSENILTIKKLLNNKNISNMVNGVYTTNLYRNTRPIYKQIYSKNVKCKGRSCNGLLQVCPN